MRQIPPGARRCASVTALALGLAAASLGAAPSLGEGPIRRFTTLSVEDGLPQSSVESIVQDRYGFIWFGTQEGLSRFDGYTFRVHRADPRPGFLPNDDINDLATDAGGDLWAATAGGLAYLDVETERVVAVAMPPGSEGEANRVAVDSRDRVWFSMVAGGLWVLESGGDPTGRRPRVVDDPLLPADASVAALAVSGGSIWCGRDGRLLKLSLEGAEVRARETIAGLGSITAVAEDATGRVWIGHRGDRALTRLDPATGRVDSFPQAPRNVLALLPAEGGSLWIGARDGGLSRLDPGTGRVETRRHDPADPASLSEDDVAELFVASSGSLWIGTWNGGVSRLDPYAQALQSLEHRPHDAHSVIPDVIALTEARDGRLWVASRNQTVAVGDPRTRRFETLPWRLPAPGRVTGLHQAGERIYLGSERGLYSLDSTTGREVPLPRALRERQLDTAHIDLLAGSPESLWIASGQRLYCASQRQGAREDVEVRELELPFSAAVSALSPGPDRLWIGTEAGEVARVDVESGRPAGTVQRLGAPSQPVPTAPRGFVTSLAEEPEGWLWVGTRDGLGRIELQTGQVQRIGRVQGLPSLTIGGLLGDGLGRVWAATNRGLTRVDPAGGMLHLGSAEGAQGSGYAEGAFARGASGLIYFAGAGITLLDPAAVQVDPKPPRVVFTDIEISHRRASPRWLDPDSPLETAAHAALAVTLEPDADVISVEFAGLNYSDPRNHRYRYRLEGFDGDWIETDAGRRVATYTQLSPGPYRLRVRAGTKLGVWSPQEAVLELRVLPRWWQTAWARWLLAIGSLLSVAALFKLRVWSLERDRRRLEQLVLERTAELEASNRQRRQAEVSAALQSIVAGTAHEVRNPLFAISASVDAICALERSPQHERLRESLHGAVERLAALTERLLEYGTPRQPRLEPVAVDAIVDEAWDACRAAAEAREVELDTHLDAGLPVVEVDRPTIVRSFTKLLGNAIDHSPPGSAVRVIATTAGRDLVITIEDSGPGFRAEDLPRVFDPFFTTRTGASGLGLSLAQRFIESHGGHLTAGNRELGGARLVVRLPLSRV